MAGSFLGFCSAVCYIHCSFLYHHSTTTADTTFYIIQNTVPGTSFFRNHLMLNDSFLWVVVCVVVV